MKAAVLHEAGAPVFGDMPVPAGAADAVPVEVLLAGMVLPS